MTFADLVEDLAAYVTQRRPMGSFLTAVLENNLAEAIGRADESSLANLFLIVAHVYNELPSTCWGSSAKVSAWLAGVDP